MPPLRSGIFRSIVFVAIRSSYFFTLRLQDRDVIPNEVRDLFAIPNYFRIFVEN
jgi:hypothetical protein